VLVLCATLVAAGALTHRPALTLAAIGVLACAWLPEVWRAQRLGPWMAWVGVVALVVLSVAFGRAALVLSAVPVACLMAVAWLFARTLAPGREPLVTRCVRVIEGEARVALPGVAGYTRGVTVFWAGLLAALAGVSLAVALLARPGGWLAALGVATPWALPGSVLGWYPEAGCWGVVVLAFAGEYVFRRWYLRGVPQLNVLRFVLEMARRWPALVRDGAAHA
jgi:hypothetical protein